MANPVSLARKRPIVSLLLRIVPHYRVPFLERLAARLDRSGIDLQVVYGQERPGTVPHSVRIDAPWAHRVPNVYADIGRIELVWQPGLRRCMQSDLIVVEQATRLLANYVLQLGRGRLGRRRLNRRVAYWGHGKNMQSRKPNGLSERLKQSIVSGVDWWFAYTDLSRQFVASNGFPDERITVVNNAVSGAELRDGLNRLADRTDAQLLAEIGCAGKHVGLFCGSLHRDKRLPFLFAAAEKVRASVSDFELVIIGDGPESPYVREMAARHDWIKYHGAVTGALRAKYFRAADLLLMPGLVGLVIVDSFITGCPIVTTDYPFHSPEIAYLESGSNGVMTADDEDNFAAAVIDLIRDRPRLASLRAACIQSASRYTLAEMVERFASGVESCLALNSMDESVGAHA